MPDASARPTESPEKKIAVKYALSGLPPELKETAILYFVLELKQRDIARILGIGLPLVKYRIKRARELLSDSFKDDF